MAKVRKQQKRNKPIPKLCEKDVPKLGKNSNKVCYEASLKGIYYTPSPVKCPLVLAEWERKQLERLRKHFAHPHQQ